MNRNFGDVTFQNVAIWKIDRHNNIKMDVREIADK
jgi:hypothetical protein